IPDVKVQVTRPLYVVTRALLAPNLAGARFFGAARKRARSARLGTMTARVVPGEVGNLTRFSKRKLLWECDLWRCNVLCRALQTWHTGGGGPGGGHRAPAGTTSPAPRLNEQARPFPLTAPAGARSVHGERSLPHERTHPVPPRRPGPARARP